jgi:catechol 2,3-dioxygenase-like lactoylglutathione lyase family enzyme
MIDHVGLSVSNYARAKAFYERALAPLGYTLVMEVTAQVITHPAFKNGDGFVLHRRATKSLLPSAS